MAEILGPDAHTLAARWTASPSGPASRRAAGEVLADHLSTHTAFPSIARMSRNYANRRQGNRISKQSQELGEIGIVPAGALELAVQGAFGGFLLHAVQCDVPQHREVVWAVAQSVPVRVSIHHDIEPPVQPVFDPPVLADDLG